MNKKRFFFVTHFFLLVLLLSVFVGCNNSNTKQDIGYAYVSFSVLTIDSESPGYSYATLQNNIKKDVVYYGWLSDYRRMSFSDEIEFGIYTLTIYSEYYQQYIDHNFIINTEDNEFNPIIIVPEGFEGIRYTLQNNTGYDIKSVYVKTRFIWIEIPIGDFIPNENIRSFVIEENIVPSKISVKIVDTENNSYSKYEELATINSHFIFTKDDMDFDKITNHWELQDSHRFDVLVSITTVRNSPRSHRITINSFIQVSQLSMSVNNESIIFSPPNFIEGIYIFSGLYDFIQGETYLIEIETKNPHIKETVNLTISQDLNIDFPLIIGQEQIDLSWLFLPKDFINQDLVTIDLEARISCLRWRFKYIEHLLPNKRNYVIPEWFIPLIDIDDLYYLSLSNNDNWIRIWLYYTNYVVSGRVSFRSFEGYTLFYGHSENEI
ncbi:MAG: hypothetical protein FWG98_14035 [Candidatus Cloacimonetes bacterium]|nr:hypothetical protein [Candidatus Cloacimonadota bacterium]